MATVTHHLSRQVDEILEPVWQEERRRAKRRGIYAGVGRVVAGATVFLVIAVVVDLLVGVTVPWIAFACITIAAMALSVASRSDPFD